MTQFNSNAQDDETSSQHAGIRLAELYEQHWSRNKSKNLAINEGISLNDDRMAVLLYLCNYYLEHGLPRLARTTATALNQQFSPQGGNKYLRSLFVGALVSRGSHLANLRTPANATDTSFGTSYLKDDPRGIFKDPQLTLIIKTPPAWDSNQK